MQLKRQTCSCFEAQLKFVNFFYLATKNVTTHSILSGFNEDSKMGSAIFLNLFTFLLHLACPSDIHI